MKNQLAASIFLSCMLAGCATPGKNTLDTNASAPIVVHNEITVNQPYQQVWDKLVRGLSKSYYMINNIDKESRIINLSFSSTLPQEYVDCGSTERTYTNRGVTETFKYKTAASSRFKLASSIQSDPVSNYYLDINRTSSLEGRISVYLAPEQGDNTKTHVVVNTFYILSITNSGNVFRESLSGRILSSTFIPNTPPTKIKFNTGNPSQFTWTEGVTSTCSSNGKSENDILDILQN